MASYKTKLKVGDLIRVDGWVMLKGLEDGRCYKVIRRDSYSYTFAKRRGKKAIARHYIDNVDRAVRSERHPDLNKIVANPTKDRC